MNSPITLLLRAAAVVLLVSFTASAQAPPPAQPGTPAAQPVVGRIYVNLGPVSPEILPGHRVTIRLSAPKAAEVILNGDWENGRNISMTKDLEGIWSVTVGPLAPEMWTYTLSVDGVRTLDPQNLNTIRIDRGRYSNVLMIPGPGSELYKLKDVPHGTISMVWYPSPSLKMEARRLYVYTPPGYETSSERYPVLYLLHGSGGGEDSWTRMGRAEMIMDSLIGQGKARPMLVVMPNGNSNQVVAPGYALGETPAFGPMPPPTPTPGATNAPPRRDFRQDAYPDSIIKDIIPFIDRTYRVIRDKDSRALAGLSMGGMQTIRAGFPNTDKLAYLGIFSSGGGFMSGDQLIAQSGTFFEKPELTNKQLKLLYVAVGVADTRPYASTQRLRELFKERGIKYEYRESSGGHTWANWRIYLSEFAPKLFR